jgi:parallel beta-helix repeat protein
MDDNQYGIYFYYSSNNSIFDNILEKNAIGMFLNSDSEDNTFSRNNMIGCGIFLSVSSLYATSNIIDKTNLVNGKILYFYQNRVSLRPDDFTNAGQVILINCYDSIISNLDTSNCTAGISLYNCNNNEILNCIASNNSQAGINLIDSDYTTVSRNTLNNNLWGIKARYGVNNIISENIVNHNNYGINLAHSCHEYTVSECTLNNNHRGINLRGCRESVFSRNDISYNYDTGIFTRYSNDNLFTGNIINYNKLGMNLSSSDLNEITQNHINYNNMTGVLVSGTSEGNKIYYNCFNNSLNAIDDGLNNNWDNSFKVYSWNDKGKEGNYWIDYTGLDLDANGIGDIPYNISGSAGSQDNFPLIKCPIYARVEIENPDIPILLITSIILILVAFVGVVAHFLIRIKRRMVWN